MQNSLAEAPFSILGLDVHRNNAGERALALTGTLDKSCVALKGWVTGTNSCVTTLFHLACVGDPVVQTAS